MVIVKLNAFSFLQLPISAKLFGKNKTWRGLIVVSCLNSIILLIICLFYPVLSLWNAVLTGFVLGLTYMMFELPNSWVKRKLGIGPGEQAKKANWLIMLLDKSDSSFGVSLVSYIIFDMSIIKAIELFLIASFIHAFFSLLLVFLKVKKSF